MLAGLRDQEEWALVGCKNRKRLHDRGLWAIGVVWLLQLWGIDAFGESGDMSPPGLVRLRLWGILQDAPWDPTTIVLLYVKIMTPSSSFTPIVFIVTHLLMDAVHSAVGYYRRTLALYYDRGAGVYSCGRLVWVLYMCPGAIRTLAPFNMGYAHCHISDRVVIWL